MPKYKGGRPKHKVTKGQRKLVRRLAYMDLTQAQIAEEMEISVPTLVANYRKDIERGKSKTLNKLMKASLKNAINNDDGPAVRERMAHLASRGVLVPKHAVDLNHTGEIRGINHFYGEDWKKPEEPEDED